MPFIAVLCPCFFHREPGPGMAHSWGRGCGWGGDWQADSGLSRGYTPGPLSFAGGSIGGTWAWLCCSGSWTAGSHGNESSSHWAQQRPGLQPCSPGYTGSGHRSSLICLVLELQGLERVGWGIGHQALSLPVVPSVRANLSRGPGRGNENLMAPESWLGGPVDFPQAAQRPLTDMGIAFNWQDSMETSCHGRNAAAFISSRS